MAEICLVCNKKIGLFSAPYPVEVGSGTKDIHFQCRHKYSITPEKYGGPSDKELERRTTEREHKVASHASKRQASVDENQANKKSSVGNSSQSAIDILSTVNTIVALCGALIVLGLFLLGFYQDQGTGWLLVAVIFGLLILVIWSLNRVFIGIAEDVKGIRKRLEDSN